MSQAVFTGVFDTLVSDPVTLHTGGSFEDSPDHAVFQWWCDGASLQQVVRQRSILFKQEAQNHALKMGKIPGMEFSFRRRGSSVEEMSAEAALSEKQQLERLFLRDTKDLYRIFDTAEHFLCQPDLLRSQVTLQLSPAAAQWMIRCYYALDENVLREFLGRRLAGKVRKDLGDVSEATKTPVKSCRRQFDNLRRVMTMLEESHQYHCYVMLELQEKFELGPSLAAQYMCVTFLLHHKFNLQAARHPTAGVTAQDLVWCAAGLLCFWVCPGNHRMTQHTEYLELQAELTGSRAPPFEERESTRPALEDGLAEVFGLDLDKDWIAAMREIKHLLAGETRGGPLDSLQQYTLAALREQLPPAHFKFIEAHFKSAVKQLCSIGANLGLSRECRDVFEDLIVRVFEPLLKSGSGSSAPALADILALLAAMTHHFPAAVAAAGQATPHINVHGGGGGAAAAAVGDVAATAAAWTRFMGGVRVCLLFMYSGRSDK
eukprot:TRINITY_DN85_c2_g1_i1.p1 TRINITY_DN85_c2_g1~~TRINITY_DN85_c2_g1_i1.p1  ORF type:complete len:488 (+),score=174.15 TRINITY_DN85_c2_g1_i1:115-1578(+)